MILYLKLKNWYYKRKYQKWYEKWNDYYKEHPEEFKAFIIYLKWKQLASPDSKALEDFITHGEGWLEQEGYW